MNSIQTCLNWFFESCERNEDVLTQLSSSVLNEMFDLVRENFHARLVLFIS